MSIHDWFFIYLLSTIGGTHIVVRSDIFKHIRRRFYIFLMKRRRNKYPHRNRKWVYQGYTTVLGCSLCFGLHAGWINAIWMYLIYTGVLPVQLLVINAALCTSILSQVIYLIIKLLSKHAN